MTSYLVRGFFWSTIYIALILAPLFFLLLGPVPAGSGYWWDLSAACGFIAASIMATMFVLTARFKRATAPFGIDLIYYFHRLVALAAGFFLLGHPLFLLLAEPRLVFFVRPGASPYHLKAGIAAFSAIVVIMGTSLWRKKLSIAYERWRFWHMLLAVTAMILAVVHIRGVGHYVNTAGGALLWSTILACCLAAVLYVRLGKPLWLLAHPYRVKSVVNEAGRAWTLTLRPENHPGIIFRPGQFAWLTLRTSPFGMKEHPFSITSSAQAKELSFTIKELGDFTRTIGAVQPGQLAFVDAPYGAFSIDRLPAPGYVFIAGGIGIAPIMSMLRTMVDRRDRRPVLLFYAYKTWPEMTFREELDEIGRTLDMKIVYILKQPPPDWAGEEGLVREELFRKHLATNHHRFEYLICGPVPMINSTEQALHRLGVPLRQIHSELFDLV